MLQSPPLPPHAPAYVPLFQSYQDELLHRLETIVNIDSGTGQVEGVNQIMTYLKQWLSELDFAVTLCPTESAGYNLLARRRGKGQARILLVGHVDTVYGPDAIRTNPFVIRDGTAYGPGVIDMKSGILMCIYTLRALTDACFEHYGELCVVFNNDEEVSSPQSAPLLREVARQVDIGLVLESSRSAEILTHSRKGVDKYMLEVSGVSAHSGAEPHKGRSAVIELAQKMVAIHQLNTLFPGVTFNVTRISSSEPLNVVPYMARCHIAVRAYNQQGLDMAAEAMERIVAGCSMPDTSTTLVRTPTLNRRPYEATPEIIQLVEMAQAEGEGLGLNIVSEKKGGVSDANVLVEMGVPTLDSLGPIGGGMHNLSKEHLCTDSLIQRGALLAGLIQRISLSKITG